MKTAVVTGAGGFIGHHLVSFLKGKGYYVRGVDIKYPQFEETAADQFLKLDLRFHQNAHKALESIVVDEVYALAADMGGMGFITSAETEIMRNNSLINLNTVDAAAVKGVGKYFFSSSACVYRDMRENEPPLWESNAIPANPDNEYGWEKLYAERVIQAYGRRYSLPVRIARFENTYGPLGTWQGGREKAPAALCRKAAEAKDGGTIDVWGDGTATRVFTYIDDLIGGVYVLVQSNMDQPTNLGSEEMVTVDGLARTAIFVSNKKLSLQHVEGPVGVQARNISKDRAHELGWKAETSLRDGMHKTYDWIAKQVANRR